MDLLTFHIWCKNIAVKSTLILGGLDSFHLIIMSVKAYLNNISPGGISIIVDA